MSDNKAPKEFWASPGKFRLVMVNDSNGRERDMGEFDTADAAKAQGTIEFNKSLIEDPFVVNDQGELVT